MQSTLPQTPGAILQFWLDQVGAHLIDLAKITTNLHKSSDDLWHAKHSAAISYPDWGNEACFQVEDSSFWFQHRNACILEGMKLFPPAGPVFDIGGGNGFVAKGIQDAGLEVVLVEPGITGARNAQQRGIRTVICATVQDAGFVQQSLPAIGLFDVLEHIEREKEFLSELREFLIPGGKIYLTVPAYNFLWSQEDVDAGHQRRYSRQALRNALLSAGFRIDFLTGFFRFLPPAILLARVLPYCMCISSRHAAQINHRMKQQHVPQNRFIRMVLHELQRHERLRLQGKTEAKFGASWLAVGSKI